MKITVGLTLFCVLFLSACTKEHDQLIHAVKNYYVERNTVEQVLKAKKDWLNTKGNSVNVVWEHQKVDTNHYKIVARLKVSQGSAEEETYTWKLARDPKRKKDHWKLEPNDKVTRALMKTPSKTVKNWLASRR